MWEHISSLGLQGLMGPDSLRWSHGLHQNHPKYKYPIKYYILERAFKQPLRYENCFPSQCAF